MSPVAIAGIWALHDWSFTSHVEHSAETVRSFRGFVGPVDGTAEPGEDAEEGAEHGRGVVREVAPAQEQDAHEGGGDGDGGGLHFYPRSRPQFPIDESVILGLPQLVRGQLDRPAASIPFNQVPCISWIDYLHL